MKDYFIRISTWGTSTPDIIEDETMYQAERGMNYLNPGDFDYLCEADCAHDAEEFYFDKVSKEWNDIAGEAMHP